MRPGFSHDSVSVPIRWRREKCSWLHARLRRVQLFLAAVLLVDEIVPADQRGIWGMLWDAGGKDVVPLLGIDWVKGLLVCSGVSGLCCVAR